MAMHGIGESPGKGHLRPDLADESLRLWSVFSYLIVYRPTTRPVQILRVVHGAQELAAALARVK